MTDAVRSDEGAFPQDYTYERVSASSFGDTLEAVGRAIRARGLVVRRTYDIQAALVSKGFPIQPLTIFEVDRAGDDGQTDLVGLLTPLRFNVYRRGEDVFVSALRPTFVTRVVGDEEVERLAGMLETDVVAVVDDATASRGE